jgi:hypothetical protein
VLSRQIIEFRALFADVGGGSTADGEPHALSSISLRWMVREAATAACNLRFAPGVLERLGIASHSVGPHNGCTPPTTDVLTDGTTKPMLGQATSTSQGESAIPVADLDPSTLDAVDALAPEHDELALRRHPLWWIFEILPLSYLYQDSNGAWIRRWRCVLPSFLPIRLGAEVLRV